MFKNPVSPGFNKIYDVMNNLTDNNFMSVECSYDENNKSIIFKLSDYFSEDGNQNSKKTKAFEFDLNAKKAKEISQ